MGNRTLIGLLVGLALTGLASAQDDDPFAEDDPFAGDEDPFAEYEDLAGPEGNLTEDDENADDAATDEDDGQREEDASDDKGAPGLGLVGLAAAIGAALVIFARRR